MSKSLIELVVGDLEEKKVWRQLKKRANVLPEDYSFAFKKILRYFYNFGFDMSMLADLLELFEASAAESKPAIDIVGSDVALFCDELIRVNEADNLKGGEKLNQEIQQYFQKKGK